MQCDLKVKRFRLWQITSRSILHGWWPLAEIVLPPAPICHEWTWAVSSSFPDGFIYLRALKVELNVLLWCRQTHLRIGKTHVKCIWKHEVYLGRCWSAIPATCPGDVAASCSSWSYRVICRFVFVWSALERVSKSEGQTPEKMTQILAEPGAPVWSPEWLEIKRTHL